MRLDLKTPLGRAKKASGFSLIELMVVVGIIGVLAAVGVPKYNKYQAQAKYQVGMDFASNVQTAEEAYYTVNNAYSTLTTIGAPTAAGPWVVTSPAGGATWTLGLASSSGTTSQLGACQTSNVAISASNSASAVGAPLSTAIGC